MRPPPRRPAILSPARADAIPGDPDPADRSEIAHTTAAALVDGGRNSSDPEVVRRLVQLVQTEGIEEIAGLWSASPASTLPGTLWRLYVLHTWVGRDPQNVAVRYARGRASAPALEILAGVATPPGPDEVRLTLDAILGGVFTGDLAIALERASAFCRIVAFGAGHNADDLDEYDAERASEVTRRAGRLLSTADELDSSAALWRLGRLD